jgi:sec-independent protein translocase protein TatC
MLKESSFWGHIAELTKRMKVVLATFLVSLFVMLILPANTDLFALTSNYKPLMSLLLTDISNRFLPSNADLFAGSMSDPITLYVYAALVFAVGITLPVFAYQAIKFINPALYPHEKRMIFPYVTAITFLFIAGALFGFFFLVPSFIQGFFPFYNAVNALPYIPLMDFYNIVFFTVLVSGFLFVIPVFFVLLVKFKIIKTRMISGKRKWIYAGLLVAAMLISPGATPMGDVILFIALAALVEISLFVGKIFELKNSDPDDSKSKLEAWLSRENCKYCNTVVDREKTDFCPSCKRSIK